VKNIPSIDILGIDGGPQRNAEGGVFVANENRFDNTHFSEALTAYASRVDDSDGNIALLDAVFPRVPTPRRFEYRVHSEDRGFLVETEDIRAIGDRGFKRCDAGGTLENSKTLNKGLTIALDKDEIMDGDEELSVQWLKNILTRSDLKRGFDALAAAASSTTKKWDAAADPDADMMALIESIGTALGLDPNTLVYGSTAWTYRQQALRASETAGAFAGAMMTPEQLASVLGVDRIIQAKSRYRTGEGKTKARMLAAYVYGLFLSPNPSREDPSHCKRFVTPLGGDDYRVYRQEFVKTIELSVEHYSRLAITNTTGLQRYLITQ
jgi:hypothetical protein